MVRLSPALATISTLLALGVSASVINGKREPLQPWDSLAGRSQDEIEDFIKRHGPAIVGAQPLPAQPKDTGMKLVNDRLHQYQAPKKGDKRGPCPGMNSMANHGFYNRNGVDTPQALIQGSMDAYNMGWDLASFVTIYSHVLGGNMLTNLISIGDNSPLTGHLDPAFPAAGNDGLSAHGDFEGDGSQSRRDAHFGDHVNFDPVTYNRFLALCDEYDGLYNITSGSYIRYTRYDQSKHENPDFAFQIPRYMTSAGEAAFPLGMWHDGRQMKAGHPLTCRSMETFYKNSRMPANFWRRDGPFGFDQLIDVAFQMRSLHQLTAGHNEGLGNFVLAPDGDQELLDTNGPCALYRYACHKVTTVLYPNPTGALKEAILGNFEIMYQPLSYRGPNLACPKLSPYEIPC